MRESMILRGNDFFFVCFFSFLSRLFFQKMKKKLSFPGDHHDRPRHRRPHLHRPDDPGTRRGDHRQREARRGAPDDGRYEEFFLDIFCISTTRPFCFVFSIPFLFLRLSSLALLLLFHFSLAHSLLLSHSVKINTKNNTKSKSKLKIQTKKKLEKNLQQAKPASTWPRPSPSRASSTSTASSSSAPSCLRSTRQRTANCSKTR